MEKIKLIIYCDGGSRGNPGPSASAFAVIKNGKAIHEESKFLGVETNNVAEYTAVLFAIKWLVQQIRIKNEELIINLDSQLVERQLNNKYKVKNEKLKILNNQIKLLINKNNLLIKFIWNFRDKNHLADTLVNKELDASSTGKLEIIS